MGNVDTNADKPIDGEFKDAETTALAVAPQPMEVALSSQNPEAFLKRAIAQADALKGIIDAKKLAISIGGGNKKHVLIDGWQTLMALNGVMPHTVDLKRTICDARTCTYPKCDGGKLTTTVTTELRRVQDGLVLTRVEAECSQHEPRWSKAEHYAVTSMAQTRGIGKACRQLYGWVMALAGYDATPAEEMPAQPHAEGSGSPYEERAPAPAPRSTSRRPSGQAALDTARAQASAAPAPAPAPGPAPSSIAWTEPMKDLIRSRVRFLQAEKSPVLYGEWKNFMNAKVPGDKKWEALYERAELYDEATSILGIPAAQAEAAEKPAPNAAFDPTEVPA